MTPFGIEPMSEADIPAVLALLEESQLPTVGVRENIRGFVIARSNGSVVGSAGFETYGSSGLLRSVVVAPERRREGIASELVRHITESAAREHVVDLYLLTTTARAYFERFGFVTWPRSQAPAGVRESWEFRTGCPASAVFMRCPG